MRSPTRSKRSSGAARLAGSSGSLNRVDLEDLPGGLLFIVDLAIASEIGKLGLHATDGIEGMLLTDAAQGRGGVIVNTGRGDRLARFTGTHELGRSVVEHHPPIKEQGFTCRPAELREARRETRRSPQEPEASRYARPL